MSFCKEFIWGAATASFQIEGAAHEDGKSPSVWDDFCRQEGRVYAGHDGRTACDHYHRFREDVRLMAELGIKHYRFSIAWPRVLPQGTGQVNERGLRFYSELVDALLEAGITPYVTLFHWDYPVALMHRGGWLNDDSPRWFEEYTRVVARCLGDRVRHFITLNEPQCFVGLGYTSCEHAPGLPLSIEQNLRISHNALKAHGLAVQALRELVPGCIVGYAPCASPCYPLTDSEADIAAARQMYFSMPKDPDRWMWNVTWFSDPTILGSYPEDGLQMYGHLLPEGWQRDMELICQPLDFYGQNIYNGVPVRAGGKGPVQVPFPPGFPRTALGWPITPRCLYWGPRFLYERYQLPIIITESGMSAHDAVSLDGKVHDPNRIDYLHRYLLELKKCAEDGNDIRGYFHWSLMDNFEWAHGYNERFGLIHVDYATQQRTPKDSALWYQKVMETNGECL